jgi:hypothetical protein
MDQSSAGYMYLKNKFPRISDATIKEGIFVGPQTTELIQEVKFGYKLCEVEKVAWKSFKKVTTIFFWKSYGKKTNVIWWLILYSLLQSYGVLYVLKGAFLRLTLRLIPRKPWGGER